LKGNLDLTIGVDGVGKTFLRHQHFRAPMHLSKPYFDGETLLVNVVNPTAGLFSGDTIECRVEVELGARALLASPSASRVHRATGGVASMVQSFAVRAGGFLEVYPELFIPHAGARYRQSTTVEVEEGGMMILLELVAPGRVASGEVFAFEHLEWETHVRWAGRSVVRERYPLTPETASVVAIRRRFPRFYFANVTVIGGAAVTRETVTAITGLQGNGSWLGGSRLVAGGWTIRVLAESAPELRRIIAEVRRLIYSAEQRMPPRLRRP
jgi:urease accessory protein